MRGNTRCYICGEDNPNVLENHHHVPRRYDGSDDSDNIHTLCANCHRAIERMYNDEFYSAIKEKIAAEMEASSDKTSSDGSLSADLSDWSSDSIDVDASDITIGDFAELPIDAQVSLLCECIGEEKTKMKLVSEYRKHKDPNSGISLPRL